MLEPATSGDVGLRAFLTIGGSTLARHQLRLALALECEKIVCLSRGLSPNLIAIQHEAEREHVQFQVITDPRQLAGLVSSRDDLLVLADGLLAAPALARELLTGAHAVLVQPFEIGLPAGFERLDLNHASAGAMRIPGKCVEQLGELPPDYDMVSALTRIAIQAGVMLRSVPAELREGAGWRLIQDEAVAQALEAHWVQLHIGPSPGASPGPILARMAIRRFGPALLHAGSGGNVIAIASGFILLLAVAASWFGYTATGLFFVGLAWLCRMSASLLSKVEHDSLQLPPTRFPRALLYGWLIDVVIVLLVTHGTAELPFHNSLESAFAPLMLIGLLRILPRHGGQVWSAWLKDRLLLSTLLSIGAAAGYLPGIVMLLALLVLGAALFAPRPASRITGP